MLEAILKFFVLSKIMQLSLSFTFKFCKGNNKKDNILENISLCFCYCILCNSSVEITFISTDK